MSTNDHLLTGPDREEALSRAYVQAIAAGAGYVVATMDFDRDGVDVEIKAGGAMRPSIGIQLKATINLGCLTDDSFRFPLRRRNYDLLRIATQMPRLLVVLDLPRDEGQWITVTSESLILQRSAFWASLAGAPDIDNDATITVAISGKNRLDTGSLRALMEQSRTGTIR
jgi:hypothetical protein